MNTWEIQATQSYVAIDFTHPLISPMIAAAWPDLGLIAQRAGIVDQYRTSRVFGLPIVAFTTPPTPIPPTLMPILTFVPTATEDTGSLDRYR